MPTPSRSWDLTANDAQPRVSRDRLAALFLATRKEACGADWGMGSGWFWEPSSGLITIVPNRMEPEWWTHNAGRWEKLGLGDVVTSGGSWEEAAVGGAGDLRLYGSDCSGATVTLPSLTQANVGWVLGFYAYGPGAERHKVATAVWPGSPSVSLALWSDGTIDVSVGSALIESKSVGGSTGSGGDSAGRWFDLLIRPVRTRQLSVFCPTTGEGFVATRRDLPAGQGPQAVLPACQPHILCHAPSQVIQAATIRCRPTATVYSEPLALAEPPATTGENPFQRSYWFSVGGTGQACAVSLAALDGSAFAPDGSTVACRVKAELSASTDGLFSPQLMAAVAGFSRRTQTLASDESSLMGWVERVTLNVREDGASDVRAEAVGPWPGAGSAWSSVATLKVGSFDVVRGDLKVEERADGPPERWTLLLPDPSAFLAEAPFRDPAAFDGQPLGEALRFCAGASGFPTWADPSLESQNLPAPEGPEPALAPEVGDLPSDWIRRLAEGFAPEAVCGFRPTPSGYRWEARLTDVSATAEVKVWRTLAAAKAWLVSLGYTQAEAEERGADYTARSVSERRLAAEATEVRAIGWDWGLGAPVHAVRRSASLSAASAPSSRPAGWVGRAKPFGVFEPSLRSAAECSDLADRLAPLLLRERRLYEVETGLLINPTSGMPVWRGDLVDLEGVGKCVVCSFSAVLQRQEASRGWSSARATYVLEAVGPATAWGPRSEGIGLWQSEILRRWRRSGRIGTTEVAILS